MDSKTQDKLNKIYAACKSVVQDLNSMNVRLQTNKYTTSSALKKSKPRNSRQSRSSTAAKARTTTNYKELLKDYESAIQDAGEVLANIAFIRDQDYAERTNLGIQSLRRSVLMHLLQDRARHLPLWVPEGAEDAPPMCGSVPFDKTETIPKGHNVAALIPENSSNNSSTFDSSHQECWILAEIISHSTGGKYQVEDIDSGEVKQQYPLEKSKIIPLPRWKANPTSHPEAIFQKGSLVLALYPQTTCFYRALVNEPPRSVLGDYSLYFEDSTYPSGYAPPINVPQRYVIACCSNDESIRSNDKKRSTKKS